MVCGLLLLCLRVFVGWAVAVVVTVTAGVVVVCHYIVACSVSLAGTCVAGVGGLLALIAFVMVCFVAGLCSCELRWLWLAFR